MEFLGVILLCALVIITAGAVPQPPWEGLQISRYANAKEDGYTVSFVHSKAGGSGNAPNNGSLLQLFKSFQQLYPNNAIDHVIGFDINRHNDINKEAGDAKTVIDSQNELVEANQIGLDGVTVDHEVSTEMSQKHKSNSTEQPLLEFVQSCDEIKRTKSQSVGVVIVSADITPCATDIYRIVNSTQSLLIISSENQAALAYLRNQSELFEFADSSILNQLKYPGIRAFGDNKYFATYSIMTEMIYETVIKNDKTHFNIIFRKLLVKNLCQKPVHDAIIKLVANKNMGLFNMGYWIQNNFQSAAKDCVPKQIEWFLNSDRRTKIMNHDKTGVLEVKLSDNSIIINCTMKNQNNDNYQYWEIHRPLSNNSYFRIHHKGKDLRADSENEIGERKVVGDPKNYNENFLWRFEVAGSNADGDILFCIFNRQYGQLLASNTCESEQPVEVKTKDWTCDPNAAWIFMPKL